MDSENLPDPPPRLAARYFDGRSGRAQPVQAWVEGGRLHWGAEGQAPLSVAAGQAVWPERQRHGQRQLLLPEGGVLAFEDAPAFDTWAAAAGRQPRGVVRWQQSWRLTALALALLVLGFFALWRWGIPAAAELAVAHLPPAVEAEIGTRTLAWVDQEWLKPSRLDEATQAEVARRLQAVVQASQRGMGAAPAWRLRLRDGGRLGPNAFALPGGDVVVTDALVKLLQDQPQALAGVLAHELGHLKHRHGLRLAAQAAAVGVLAGVVLGDFSFLLASAPAWLAQLDYSRDFEREADTHARDLLRAAGIDPRVMVEFFRRMEAQEGGDAARVLPIAFSSHPANAERIAFFSR